MPAHPVEALKHRLDALPPEQRRVLSKVTFVTRLQPSRAGWSTAWAAKRPATSAPVARDQREAIAKAIEEFEITDPTERKRIIVQRRAVAGGISIDAVTPCCAADALRLGFCCHADTRRSSAKECSPGLTSKLTAARSAHARTTYAARGSII